MIGEKLAHYFPNDQWAVVSNDDYGTLSWFGPGSKPTEQEIADLEWPPTPSVEQVQAEAMRRLRALASAYEPEERETWQTQIEEAQAIKAGLAETPAVTASAPLLAPIAASSGRTMEEMADRVLFLAAQFAAGSGIILASRNELIAQDPIPADFTDDVHWL